MPAIRHTRRRRALARRESPATAVKPVCKMIAEPLRSDWMNIRCMTIRYILCAGFFLGAILGGSPVAHAQDSPAPEQERFSREEILPERPSTAKEDAPEWADPSPNTPRESGELSDGPRTKVVGNAPTTPGAASRTPVDGGVALLAAAGAGYAIRRLGQDDEDAPEE